MALTENPPLDSAGLQKAFHEQGLRMAALGVTRKLHGLHLGRFTCIMLGSFVSGLGRDSMELLPVSLLVSGAVAACFHEVIYARMTTKEPGLSRLLFADALDRDRLVAVPAGLPVLGGGLDGCIYGARRGFPPTFFLTPS